MMIIAPLKMALQQVYVPDPSLCHIVSDHWFAKCCLYPAYSAQKRRKDYVDLENSEESITL